ncbi:MAG TPA: hypothetical protein ENK06_04485 [Gammaproteobacteria bacterium]|nr:hypothetical protein [Gammaproteobacteria bacterium]
MRYKSLEFYLPGTLYSYELAYAGRLKLAPESKKVDFVVLYIATQKAVIRFSNPKETWNDCLEVCRRVQNTL